MCSRIAHLVRKVFVVLSKGLFISNSENADEYTLTQEVFTRNWH
ncbi:hypothetical protein NSE_0033 [Neorickettsia sennetsu str. Miyayama]|uniref:Uncharacterized protein n=1 Tax=Ehrlichia sennetsu (strain ATCC VR-367 / Miyayama) TaxID=222891 RepID=Q2GF20_EHRS3|nr:hypothetical protein NSE_0033 [Neorickettsia sennetsu str. Miyayama]